MRKPLAAREHMVRTDPGSLSETTVARIDRGGNPLPEPDLRAPGRKGPGLAGQDLRGWDHSRGLVSFLGQRAAEIGTDGEAAVQAGEAQQLRDREAGSGQAQDDAEPSGAALRADQHG